MSTFAQTSSGDLALTNGRLTLLEGAAATAVKLRNKFRLVQGEWFLDTRLGVPYRPYVWVKKPNAAVLRQVLSQVVTDTPGVQALDSMDITLDGKTRKLSVKFRARATDGSEITGGEGTPFIIQVTP